MSEMRFSVDDLFPKVDASIEHATMKDNRVLINVNEEQCVFPASYLLHNCGCKKCYNPSTQSYTSLFQDLVDDEKLVDAIYIKENKLIIEWNNGHVSAYTASWLYNRRFSKNAQEKRNAMTYPKQGVPWTNPGNFEIKQATWDDVTETTEGFIKFGTSLCRDGIFIITGSPDRFIAEEFAEKTGIYQMSTHYGKIFAVENQPTPNNLAYTAKKLELHIDQAYLKKAPMIQYLHTLIQAQVGGENVMSDGIHAANLLRKRNPEAYKTLTTVKVGFEDLLDLSGTDNHFLVNHTPVIQLDEFSQPEYIFWNHGVHSSLYNGDVCAYESWMSAMKEFYKILREVSITIRTNPGDILVFDNQRVMHGREAYCSTQSRKLEGWYSDWDWVISKLRVAKCRANLNQQQCKE